jgi:hypothetical protein
MQLPFTPFFCTFEPFNHSQTSTPMATIAPSQVKKFDASSLEAIAYESVKQIPTKEPNDQVRLGYHIWTYLKEKNGTVADAVKNSGARILIPEKEASAIIEAALKEKSA